MAERVTYIFHYRYNSCNYFLGLLRGWHRHVCTYSTRQPDYPHPSTFSLMSALFGMQHVRGEVQCGILVRHDYQSQVARILSCKICRGLKKKKNLHGHLDSYVIGSKPNATSSWAQIIFQQGNITSYHLNVPLCSHCF